VNSRLGLNKRTAKSSRRGVLADYALIANNLRQDVRLWWLWMPIAGIILPTRVNPHAHVKNPKIMRRLVTLRLRSGSVLTIRLSDIYVPIEIFGLRSYGVSELESLRVRQIVDIGANVGVSVLWFAHRFPQARILAIEPGVEASAMLEKNVRANGLQDRVDIWRVAVGGRQGSGNLAHGANLATNYMVDASAIGASTSRHETIDTERVDVVTLQDVLERIPDGQIDLLKMDCEGGEFEFLGARDRSELERINTVVGEYHTSRERSWLDLKRVLLDAGFRVEAETPEEPIGMFSASRLAQ